MQYKDEFICEGTEKYVAATLPHKKIKSGCRVGQMIAEQFGHTVLIRPDGEKVYKLEFVAFPIDKYFDLMRRLETILIDNPPLQSQVLSAINDAHYINLPETQNHD